MTKHILKQAMEALKRYQRGEYRNCGELIGEIEAELARPDHDSIGLFTGKFNSGIGGNICIEVKCYGSIPMAGAKLYIEPQVREPLSDDEIFKIAAQAGFDIDYECPDTGKYGFRNESGDVENEFMLKLVRAVEKAHGIEQ